MDLLKCILCMIECNFRYSFDSIFCVLDLWYSLIRRNGLVLGSHGAIHFDSGMPESKPVVDLSWQPHLHTPSLSKVTNDGSHTKSQTSASNSTLWKPNTELVDGLFVLPNNPRKLHKLLRKQVEDTSGKNWYVDYDLNSKACFFFFIRSKSFFFKKNF